MFKSIFFSVLFLFGVFFMANAQCFREGEQVVNIGLGLGSGLAAGKVGVAPISVSYEKGMWSGFIDKDVVSVGGFVGYTNSRRNYIAGYDYIYSYMVIGGRLAMHYPVIDNNKLDTYGGLMLGYSIASVKVEPALLNAFVPAVGGPTWTLFLGARYYFTDQLAGVIELGHGISYLNVGIGFKL
jgi:hypothetical protein